MDPFHARPTPKPTPTPTPTGPTTTRGGRPAPRIFGPAPRLIGPALVATVAVVLLGAAGWSAALGAQPVPTLPPVLASPAPVGAAVPASPAVSPAATATATAPPTSAPPPALAATPVPGATPVTFRAEAAEIGPVVWASTIDPTTKAPGAAVAVFPPDAPTIYAALPVARLRAGSTIGASWRYNDTPIDGFVSAVRADADEQNIWVEFHLTRATAFPWPSGTYLIAVTLDGQPAQVATVEVAPAAGPVQPTAPTP